jgi:hypothetical protein
MRFLLRHFATPNKNKTNIIQGNSFWQYSIPHQKRQNHNIADQLFKYDIARELVHRAHSAAQNITKCKTTIIMPYGFEVLPKWPRWPGRHYPAIGYPSNISHQEAENFSNIFLSIFLWQVQSQYPEFYEKLKYIGIHKNGRYSALREKDYTYEKLANINTMHIALFQTPDILEHYANYVMTLFGAMVVENTNIPEIKDFETSKTRRNRLFQLLIMCNSIAESVLPHLPALTDTQKELYDAIFVELRTQNPSELINGAPTFILPISSKECRIRDELVFPRLAKIRKHLDKQPGEKISLISEAYYDGETILEASLPVSLVDKGKSIIKETYHDFPKRVATVNRQLSEQPVISEVLRTK